MLVALLALVITILLAIQVPAVQGRIAGKAAETLSERFDGKLAFSSIYVHPFNALVIRDAYMLDDAPYYDGTHPAQDTLFRAGLIKASFSLKGFRQEGIHIRKATVEDAMLAIVAEKDTLYRMNLNRIFHIVPRGIIPEGDIFDIKKVDIKDFEFRFINYKQPLENWSKYCIDWSDLDVTASARAYDLKLSDGFMTGVVDHAEAVEKSGYRLGHVSGSADVGRGRSIVSNIHFQDSESDFYLSEYRMDYANMRSFRYFISKVKVSGIIGSGILSLNTLAHMAPLPAGTGLIADLKGGRVSGVLADRLDISGLSFLETESMSSVLLDAGIKGVTDIQNLEADFSLRDFTSTTAGVETLIRRFTGKAPDLSMYAPGKKISLSAVGHGTAQGLSIDALANVGNGSVSASAGILNLLDKEKDTEVNGTVSLDNLDVGSIIGKDFVKEVSMFSELDASISDDGIKLSIDSLNVSRLNVLGYDYSNIRAAGTFSQKAFNGRVICGDPNLNLLFQGIFNLSRTTNNALYKFVASVGYADLHALGIDKRANSKISLGQLNADYTRVVKGELRGKVEARNLRMESNDGTEVIKNISMSSVSGNGRHNILFSSDFADAQLQGSGTAAQLVKDIQTVTLGRELPSLLPSAVGKWSGNDYQLECNFHDSRALLSYAVPGLYVADSTSLKFTLAQSGDLSGKVSSSRLAFKDKFLKALNVDFDNKGNALNCKLTSDEIQLGEGIGILNNSLMLYADDGNLGLGYYFDNASELENRGEIYLTSNIFRNADDSLCVDVQSLTSNIYMNGNQWRIKPSEVHFNGSTLSIDDFSLESGAQRIALRGGVSRKSADSLYMDVSDFDLDLFSKVLPDDMYLDGSVNGRVMLASPIGSGMGLEADLVSEGTAFSGYDAGRLGIRAAWDKARSGVSASLSNELEGRSPLKLNAFYSPSSKEIEADADLDGFEIGYFSPFLKDVFKTMEGKLSGSFQLSGTTDAPRISSKDAGISDGVLHVAFTDVPYYLEGPLHIDSDGAHFDNISFRDRRSGTGTVNGSILWGGFSNPQMDVHLRMENLLCIDMKESAGEAFYGTIPGTGRLSITGPFNSLMFEGEASTSGQGELHIPLKGTLAASSDLLSFKEEEKIVWIDPYDAMMQRISKEYNQANVSIGMKLKVNVSPSIEGFVEIDKASGNVLSGHGSGSISLDVRNENLSINGDYTLMDGNYKFVAMNIANRDFTIQNGSSIKFNGDIFDSDLDITALYTTKASLSSLIADTTSVSSRRTVECGISISDKIRNPSLTFSVDIPDLDPTTKSMVESALNTEDKVQKQFLSMLVTGNFLPDDQSGIVNNSNMLLSNVADIMANQLNNILQKLEIPLDLDLNYQSAQGGQSIFDVALSTQLFNNRVIVNGAIGNRQYGPSTTTTGDVVGDIDIEIKLDRSGSVRLNLFSHSADQYTNYLDNAQRNGVGIVYQKEFNKFIDFLRGLFASKEKKQQQEIERLMQTDDMKVIYIE